MPNAYVLNQKTTSYGPAMGLLVNMLTSAGWTVQSSGTGPAGVVSSSSTVTITVATPAVVTWTAHGLLIGSPIVFSTTGALPVGITAGTTYYVLGTGYTANTFRISLTREGTAIGTSGAGSGTHTASVRNVHLTSVGPAAVKMSISNPAVVYWPNHGLPVGASVQFQFFGNSANGPTGINSPQNYFVLGAGYTSNSFRIASTITGSAVITTGLGRGWIRCYASCGWGSAWSSGGTDWPWIRLQDPGGVRELVLQMDQAGQARIKYSASAKFTGGTITAGQCPTATDERYLWGSSSALSAFMLTTGSSPNHVAVPMIWQGAAMSTPPYGFWFAGMTPGTGYQYTALMMDPVVSVPEDPDPVVFHVAGTGFLDGLCLADTTGSGFGNTLGRPIGTAATWTFASGGTTAGNFAYVDVSKTAFARVQPLQYVCTGPTSSSFYIGPIAGTTQVGLQSSFPYSSSYIGPNQFNSQFDALPVAWVRAALPESPSSTFCGGLKGWSTMLRWTTAYRASFSDTMDDKRWICVGPFWLPWDGVTTPKND